MQSTPAAAAAGMASPFLCISKWITILDSNGSESEHGVNYLNTFLFATK